MAIYRSIYCYILSYTLICSYIHAIIYGYVCLYIVFLVSGFVFLMSGLVYGCLDLYLGVWTCIWVSVLVFWTCILDLFVFLVSGLPRSTRSWMRPWCQMLTRSIPVPKPPRERLKGPADNTPKGAGR